MWTKKSAGGKGREKLQVVSVVHKAREYTVSSVGSLSRHRYPWGKVGGVTLSWVKGGSKCWGVSHQWRDNQFRSFTVHPCHAQIRESSRVSVARVSFVRG